MNNEQKERLADEIFVKQPNMLASVVVLPRLGVSAEKSGIALDTLFICFQAMKESGLTWPSITENEQEHQMQRNNIILRFYDSLMTRLSGQVLCSNMSTVIQRKSCSPGS